MEGEYEVTIRLTIKKVAPGKRDKVSPKKQEPVGKVAEKEVENKKKKERVVDRIIQRVVETSTPYNTWVKTPQSTNIAGYFYFQGSRKLSIEFKGGEVYTYHNVPEDVFKEFGRAQSVGRAFNGLIRKRYSHSVGLPTLEEREETKQ